MPSLEEYRKSRDRLPSMEREAMKNRADDFERRAKQGKEENARRLDERIVWLAGGALVVIANIALSARFENLQHLEILLLSFVAFGLCLVLTIASYGTAADYFRTIDAIKELSQIPGNVPETVNNKSDAEKILWNMELHRSKGEHLIRVIIFLSRVVYLLCVVGIFSFIVFGIINLEPEFLS